MTESEEVYAFYYHVGLAMAQWAHVETELEFISSACSAEGAVGFRAIENFRSKTAYVDALVRHKYAAAPERIDVWARLYKKVMGASFKRNEIVHKTPYRVVGAKPGSRIALMTLSPSEKADRIGEGIDVKEMANRALEFAALYRQLWHFAGYLGAKVGSMSPTPPEQPTRRWTLRDIEARMREAHGRQPRPSRRKSSQTKDAS